MPYAELAILLPCHSLEDFPVYQEGPEAEGLLAAWSALWHPALLASAQRLPTWYRADSPPDEVADRLFVIPSLSEPLLVAGWTSRAHDERACVVRKTRARDDILAAALAGLPDAPRIEHGLVADFLSLGVCYLLVELLTRQMRYMSNIDDIHLRNQAVAAASAACEGRDAEAREQLSKCFEVLTEARERFYPVEAYLVDLVLVAPTTLGESLRAELADPSPKSVMIASELVQRLADQQPQSLSMLRTALERKQISLVGGEYVEDELPLLPIETIQRQFQHGLAVYEHLLGCRPGVYGRRRFGLSPLLPAVLSADGFCGALHFTLDEGHFPHASQGKTRWEGLDSSSIDALSRLPLDASKAESVLSYSRKMGETMDRDHVATLVFAHWPGQTCSFFADLRRMANYAPALGKLVTLDEFFQKTDRPGEVTKFRADQYRAPYLRQAIIREESNPLSRITDRHINRVRAESVHAIAALADMLAGKTIAPQIDLANVDETAHSKEGITQSAAALAERLCAPSGSVASSGRVGQACEASAGPPERIGEPALAEASLSHPTQNKHGFLAINPHPFSRREVVRLPATAQLPVTGGAVVAAQTLGHETQLAVELPPMGFAWIAPGSTAAAASTAKRKRKAAEKELSINNELMQVVINRETGGIRSVYDVGQRGNLLSQQLAFRMPPPKPKPGDLWRDPDSETGYSTMVAREVIITASGPAFNEATSIGQIVDPEGKRIAGFVQRVGLGRGSRVATIDIELDIDLPPRADPWNSYYACRFAWGDESAELYRSVGLTSQVSDARNLEAPYFIDIRAAKSRATILTGGWPYHRRVGSRMLDTLLIVRGESRRHFCLGVGAGLAHPAPHALALLDPPSVVACGAPPKTPSGWLFHIDAKSVVATHWETIDEGGVVNGFRARLWETEGRAGRVHMRVFRPPSSARRLTIAGQSLTDLPISGDTIAVDFSPFEWLQIEGRW
jgi:alpha-mannosidase